MKKIACLVLAGAMMLSAMNVFAGTDSGIITNRTGNIIGSGSLSANGSSASAYTFSQVAGYGITTKVRYASERDTGSWAVGGTSAYTTPAGVSGVVNMAESSHALDSNRIGLIVYL